MKSLSDISLLEKPLLMNLAASASLLVSRNFFRDLWYAKQNQFVMGDVGLNLNSAMGEITIDSITPAFYSHTDYFSSTAMNRNMDGFGLFNNMFYSDINGSRLAEYPDQVELEQ